MAPMVAWHDPRNRVSPPKLVERAPWSHQNGSSFARPNTVWGRSA